MMSPLIFGTRHINFFSKLCEDDVSILVKTFWPFIRTCINVVPLYIRDITLVKMAFHIYDSTK